MATLLKSLLTDKIFQFYYYKYFNSKEYEEFYRLNDKEKVDFLASLFLYVSEKSIYSGLKSRDTSYLSFREIKETDRYKSIATTTTEIFDKINNLKDENKKQNFLNKMNKLNTSTTNAEDTEYNKTNLNNILRKYNNPTRMYLTTEINTLELRSLIFNIENNLQKSIEDDLGNYIRDENNNERINSNIDDEMCEKLNEAHYPINIPTYQSTFYKADYNKSIKPNLESVLKISEEHYLYDNREIFLLDYQMDYVVSKNNFINVFDDGYKKLTNPHRKSEVNSLSNVLFDNKLSKIIINSVSKKNLSKKNLLLNPRPCKTIIEDLILINETISDTIEANLEKTRKKCYFGRDLIDRIYFCPVNSSIVLDYNEANKIGILLLDSLRIEGDNEILRNDNENFKLTQNLKLEEFTKNFEEEKERLILENEFLKENSQKKLEIVYEYISVLKSKLEYAQKLINEANNPRGSLDNSQIIESINKNLDCLTKNNNEHDFLDIHSTNGIENPFSEDHSTLKSVDFYVKKKLSQNINTNSQSNIQSRSIKLSPAKI